MLNYSDVILHFLVCPAALLLEQLKQIHLLGGFCETAVAEDHTEGMRLCDDIDNCRCHHTIETGHEVAIIHIIDGTMEKLAAAIDTLEPWRSVTFKSSMT